MGIALANDPYFGDGTFGKDIPTSPNQKFFTPKFRPGGGRGQAIINAAIIGGKFVYKHRKFFTRVGAVGTGYGVTLKNGSRKDTFPKAYRPVLSRSYHSRKRVKQNYCVRCRKNCCRQCN